MSLLMDLLMWSLFGHKSVDMLSCSVMIGAMRGYKRDIEMSFGYWARPGGLSGQFSFPDL